MVLTSGGRGSETTDEDVNGEETLASLWILSSVSSFVIFSLSSSSSSSSSHPLPIIAQPHAGCSQDELRSAD